MRDIAHLLRPGHLAQLRAILDDPEASPNDRFVALELLKNACIAAGGVLPVVPGHRHRDREGQEGRARAHRRRRRGGDRPRHLRHLRRRQPALLADGAARHVRREEHRHQPARPRSRSYAVDGDAYKFLFMAKGGGSANKSFLFQETKALLNPTSLHALPRREAAHARHRRLPAVPPRRRHRRHVGRVRAEDGEARVGPLPRHAAARRATSSAAASATSSSSRGAASSRRTFGIGAQFGGKYFCHDVRVIRLPRHGASCPVAHRGVVLGRPPGARQDHRRRRVPRAARDATRRSTCPTSPTTSLDGDARSCASTSTGRWPRSAPSSSQYPVKTRLSLTGPMVVARDIAHAKIKERLDAGEADAAVPARPLRLLRRPGQDARGLRVGLVRPDHRRPHGLLRRPVPGRTAAAS